MDPQPNSNTQSTTQTNSNPNQPSSTLKPQLQSQQNNNLQSQNKHIQHIQLQQNILEYHNSDSQVLDKQTLSALKMFRSIFNQKQEWNLTSNKWVRLKLKKVFENLSLAKPTKIDLTHNQQPYLLHSLACLSIFPSLKELRLCTYLLGNQGNNKIGSLENLTFIDFPVLEDLNMSDNDIVEIKSLRKVNWTGQNIKKVGFYANRVQSLEWIGRVDFMTKPKRIDEKISNEQYGKEKEQNQQREHEEQKEQEQLPGLSLFFGINQIRCIEQLNKLQRQAVEPSATRQFHPKSIWEISQSSKNLFHKSSDQLEEHQYISPQYKNNRRLMLSVELNKTVYKLNYNYFRRNYLPIDYICA